MEKKIILIVGASGVGKDSLIKEIEKEYKEKVNFITRYITREADENEKNNYLNKDEFSTLKEKDFFVSTWQAHNNFYGIAKDSIKNGINIISISRGNIIDFEKIYKNTFTINITLSKDELKKRLVKRGRENIEEIEKRLNRKYTKITANNLIEFDNSKDFIVSFNNFKKLLESIINK